MKEDQEKSGAVIGMEGVNIRFVIISILGLVNLLGKFSPWISNLT